MSDENTKMEDTIWDHSASDLSYDSEFFTKELSVISNITSKNLHTLKDIQRNLATLETLNNKPDSLPNVEKSASCLKEREEYEQRFRLQESIAQQLKQEEIATKKNIEAIKSKLQAVESEIARLSAEKKMLRKGHKAAEVILEKINDHYKSNFGIQLDFVGDESGVSTFLLRFEENQSKPLKLAFNSTTSEISLLEVDGLSDEQMAQVRKLLQDKSETAGVFCMIRDLYVKSE